MTYDCSTLARCNILARVNSLLSLSLPIHQSAALTLLPEQTLTSNDQRAARQRDVLPWWRRGLFNVSGSACRKQDCPRSCRRRAARCAQPKKGDGVEASSGLL
ncbi:hypothetical protein B5807_04139 [Epicoccum nigrum]|uniref:Uncharacterized protein n=1 Tax=Epicoccum nigrum TaxID=105696 RepID=A0A1Y2M352_EPING|nr:hypothetical protein B5807_04139 [Epicoccum nigrum]